MELKVIVTGATGMVGEGVMMECLNDPDVKEVLIVVRRAYSGSHPKLKELIVSDFTKLDEYSAQLTGYDACFFCAGVSSIGMSEAEYTRLTYNLTISFAKALVKLNPNMVFDYVSGQATDSTEKGRMMWARVKGRTENDLMKLGFKAVFNFRPGMMKPTPGQKSLKRFYKIITALYPLMSLLAPNSTCTLKEVGIAMINTVIKGYPKNNIEVKDIKALAKI